MVPQLQPQVPGHLPPLGLELLESLRGAPESAEFVLGGGVALAHYVDHRDTFDVDAWWRSAPDESAWATVVQRMQALSRRHGFEFSERGWGATRSAELRLGTRKQFSFQVATREIQLDAPLPSCWMPLWIETFRDNLASKMKALVARGAPRDFQDIAEVCHRGLATPADCWELWRLKNPEDELGAAQRAVLNHLERIESRRALASLDPAARAQAEATRRFIREELCRPHD